MGAKGVAASFKLNKISKVSKLKDLKIWKFGNLEMDLSQIERLKD